VHVPDDDQLHALTFATEVEARASLRGHAITMRLLRPPFAALGAGELRVLRATERNGRVELVVGYERYERLERSERRT